jgi:hypothetical protein
MHGAGVQRHLSHASAGATPACLAGRLTSMSAGLKAVGHPEQMRMLSDAPVKLLSFLLRCHNPGPGVITAAAVVVAVAVAAAAVVAVVAPHHKLQG